MEPRLGHAGIVSPSSPKNSADRALRENSQGARRPCLGSSRSRRGPHEEGRRRADAPARGCLASSRAVLRGTGQTREMRQDGDDDSVHRPPREMRRGCAGDADWSNATKRPDNPSPLPPLPQAVDTNGLEPLCYALRGGGVTRTLIDLLGGLASALAGGLSLVHVAAAYGASNAAVVLPKLPGGDGGGGGREEHAMVVSAASRPAATRGGQTPLHAACAAGSTEWVKAIVSASGGLGACDDRSSKPSVM